MEAIADRVFVHTARSANNQLAIEQGQVRGGIEYQKAGGFMTALRMYE